MNRQLPSSSQFHFLIQHKVLVVVSPRARRRYSAFSHEKRNEQRESADSWTLFTADQIVSHIRAIELFKDTGVIIVNLEYSLMALLSLTDYKWFFFLWTRLGTGYAWSLTSEINKDLYKIQTISLITNISFNIHCNLIQRKADCVSSFDIVDLLEKKKKKICKEWTVSTSLSYCMITRAN